MSRHQQRGIDIATSYAVAFAQPLRQLMRHPLGHLAGIDEDERRPMFFRVRGDPVQNLAELPPRYSRLRARSPAIQSTHRDARVATVDDHGRWSIVVHAGEQSGHHVEWSLGSREANPLQESPTLGDQGVQALETQRQ